MGGDMRYEIGQNAYIKLVLQALNLKTSAVNGLLLVRLSVYNNDVVEITESVPLFHSQIDLLPPLEIALIQLIPNNTPNGGKIEDSEAPKSLGLRQANDKHVKAIPVTKKKSRCSMPDCVDQVENFKGEIT